MDLFLTVQKLDQDGEWLPTSVFGLAHPGAWARVRVSHRALDQKLSTDFQPVQSHLVEQRLSPGEIVAVDVAFYPHARIWHAGETLRLRVAGRYIRKDWFEPFSYDTDNKGRHIIHAGGKFGSYLQIPIIPPKHRSGSLYLSMMPESRAAVDELWRCEVCRACYFYLYRIVPSRN
jgi:hypothetical protein